MTSKTYSVKASEIERKWHLIDATDKVLGRISTEVAALLLGKHKTVERTFGHVKWNLGFRRFHLRGLEKARLEFGMICLAYNVKRYLGTAVQCVWLWLVRYNRIPFAPKRLAAARSSRKWLPMRHNVLERAETP